MYYAITVYGDVYEVETDKVIMERAIEKNAIVLYVEGNSMLVPGTTSFSRLCNMIKSKVKEGYAIKREGNLVVASKGNLEATLCNVGLFTVKTERLS